MIAISLRYAACAALLLAAGCSTPKAAVVESPGPVTQPTADAARSRWPDATVASLEEGRQLFLSSCNRCHGYPDIMKYSEERWPGIVESMGKKAKLSDDQRELVKRFVVAAHASGSAG